MELCSERSHPTSPTNKLKDSKGVDASLTLLLLIDMIGMLSSQYLAMTKLIVFAGFSFLLILLDHHNSQVKMIHFSGFW